MGRFATKTMESLYSSIVRYPGRWVSGFLAALIGLSVLPASLLEQLTPWNQSPEWARLVVQVGALLIVVVGGVVPVAKWYEDRVAKVVSKPIVVTDCLADRSHQIRNLGDAPAVNVWLLVDGYGAPISLGSLDAHEARRLPESVVTNRHILLAAARPGTLRPYTATFNVRDTADVAFRHGFIDRHTEARLRRGGSVDQYLRHERAELIRQFEAFAGPASAASSQVV